MLIPTKHEPLNQSLLVLGAYILERLKVNDQDIESLFQKLNKAKSVTLEDYYDVLTFLWLGGLIRVTGIKITILKNAIT